MPLKYNYALGVSRLQCVDLISLCSGVAVHGAMASSKLETVLPHSQFALQYTTALQRRWPEPQVS